MSGIEIVDGWLVLPYTGQETSQVEVSLGRTSPDEWRPAFFDYHRGVRVLKVRPGNATGKQLVFLRIDGQVTNAGIFQP